MQELSIVIPFFNGHKTIQRLLDSLPANLPVIIVDDMSDEPLRPVPKRPGLQLIGRNIKGYFTGAVNRGIEACNGDVLILNQDVYFTGNSWLKLLAEKRGRYGLIGEGIQAQHPHWRQGYIHGTFMYISRDVINKIGLLNEVDYPLWGSTCEYQLRACRAGFKALPLKSIPDFVHTRKGQFGSGIQAVLKREPEKKALFTDVPPKISVVTACYNYGRFLPDLVSSLIGGVTSLGEAPGQSFQSFELVIVDDGSTDETLEIGRRLADEWKGIRYIRRENGGSAAAINTAIKAAYGEYIAVIDSDDMMESDRLERLYRLQLQNPYSFIFDETILFGSGQRGVMYQGKKVNRMRLHEYDFEKVLQKNGVHKGIFFPKRAWEDTGGYPEIMRYGREDWAFNVALGLKGWCGVKVPDYAGYLYRREGHNRTLTNTSPDWRKKFQEQMLTLYPDVYRGHRPMGCCGSSKIQAAKLNGGGGATMQAQLLPGSRDGMEILEYIGTSTSDMSWWGPVTRTRYEFGGNKRRGHVDKRDAPKMVALVDQGKPVFRVYQMPAENPKVVVSIEANQLMETVGHLQSELNRIESELPGEALINDPAVAMGANSQVGIILPFDPAGFSVNALKGQLNSLNESQLEALLKAEKSNLNRKGAINAIGEVLNG